MEEPQWICTDSDNQQYGRQLAERIFQFKEKTKSIYPLDEDAFDVDEVEMIINLDDYDEEGMYNNVCHYYGWEDFQEFLKRPDGLYIIAECIFEQESGNY